jgi:hypothetical protein
MLRRSLPAARFCMITKKAGVGLRQTSLGIALRTDRPKNTTLRAQVQQLLR